MWTVVFVIGAGIFLWQTFLRFSVLLRLRSDDGRSYHFRTWGRRAWTTLVYAFGQKKFFRDDQPAGFMHIIIFWGFLVLSLQVVTMFLRGWWPHFYLPGFQNSTVGQIYALLKDCFEVAVILAVGIALYRWTLSKPNRLMGYLPAEKRLRSQSHSEATLILSFILMIMVSGLVYDAGRILTSVDTSAQAEAAWQPVTAWLASGLLPRDWADTATALSWWVHNVVVLLFLNLLPRSKHFHIITAIPNVFLGKVEPKGELPKRDLTSDNALFGRSQLPQFTWKQALDMFSCTECGRCSESCPATATGKPLAPRQFLLDLRDSLYAQQKRLIQKNSDWDTVVGAGKPIQDAVVWSCVECRACEEACPVNIEYVDKMVDLRQHLVQEASRFPAELNRAFRGMETNSNPWGISREERDAWARDFDVPRIQDKPDAEYLYYVGCGGSFDANNKKATVAFVKILKEANVSFAILGKDETCNGDSARRLGNEYLFQTLSENLSQTLQKQGVKKIVVNCPHCFNTLSNEYPQFGKSWEVTHAAALVAKLVSEGKIKMDGSFDKRVVYHDSCYYGRFNDIYDEPRNLIQAIPGTQLQEMERCRHKGMCCGAGGGRMWMEEPADARVNLMRTDQALEKKPEIIATSCPFCRIMIGSGINEKGLSDKVEVLDVMEIVSRNMS